MKNIITILTLMSLFFVFSFNASAWCDEWTGAFDDNYEYELQNRINDYRARIGVRPLAERYRYYEQSSNAKLKLMLRSGQFSHSPWGISWTKTLNSCGIYPGMGENLVSANAGSPEGAMTAMLGSPEHKRNLEDPSWRFFGVSCAKNYKPMYWQMSSTQMMDGTYCAITFSD